MLAHCDDAFYAMTCEYAPKQITPQASSDLRTRLLQVIYPLGLLRFLNETKQLGLNFAKASITDSFDPTTMTLSMEAYLRKLLKGSETPTLAETLLREIQQHSATYDPSELCNGHDFFQILACYFKDKNKTIRKQPGGEGLEHDIRIAYTYACFKQTVLFQKLFAWAQETNCTLFIEATQQA
jgi:hypothetical protein